VLAIVRRLNPSRGPAGPGLALNLGGRQLLSPAATALAVPGAPLSTPSTPSAKPTPRGAWRPASCL